jgi:hypothetical protein
VQQDVPVSQPHGVQVQKVQKHQDRVAVIIENRPLENVVPVILHFHSVLGPEWPIIFYTVPTTSDELLQSAPFSRAVKEGRIEVRHLPAEVLFSEHRAVSNFLTGTWIWADLAPYQKVFMFQADSIICSGSNATVDDFLEWDLIGAPIDPRYGNGYNGGLSIRSRELVLDICEQFSFVNESSIPNPPRHKQFEDQWLYWRMTQLPAKVDGSPRAKLPTVEEAAKFSVETVWGERPLGYHQPSRWQSNNMGKISKYCPEVGMLTGAAFF